VYLAPGARFASTGTPLVKLNKEIGEPHTRARSPLSSGLVVLCRSKLNRTEWIDVMCCGAGVVKGSPNGELIVVSMCN
jgi:hypothetical protein